MFLWRRIAPEMIEINKEYIDSNRCGKAFVVLYVADRERFPEHKKEGGTENGKESDGHPRSIPGQHPTATEETAGVCLCEGQHGKPDTGRILCHTGGILHG